MSEILLRTKLMVPAPRPQLVPRPRLAEKLRRAAEVPLTLVSAPPGFGKTTLLATLSHELAASSIELQPRATQNSALAWLSLDSDDNEPARFWRYFAAALQHSATGLGGALAASLGVPQPPPVRPLLALLLNDLAGRTKQVMLVLDDYHLIDQVEIHDGLAFLLDHAPPNLHLVLATRADPPLPLHRLRARGQLLDIRAEDLRFDQAEAATLLTEVMGLGLTDEAVALLAEQTEGWAAGLQLAGLALQGAGNAAPRDLIARLAQSNRYIVDYLAEEVLNQQPDHVRAFLLQTSLLKRLCGPLCDAVTQTSGSQALLETLVRRNLFVAPAGAPGPGGERAWFRYHQLFADLLQGHLRQQQPDLAPLLHRRAAGWYAAHGDVESAIEHALAGEDYALVAQLLDRHAGALVMDGRALTVERWLRRLPDAQRQALPRATIAFAWALLLRGSYAAIEPYLQQAEAGIAPDDRPLRGEMYALRAALANAQGRTAAGLELARQALASVPTGNLLVQAMAHFALASAQRDIGETDVAIAAYEHAIPLCRAAGLLLPEMLGRAHLGYLCIVQGRLRRAEATIRPVLEAPVRYPAASAAHAALGEVLLEWNRLDEAEQQLRQSVALAEQSGHNAALARAQTVLARLLRARADAAGAQIALEAASARLSEGVPAWIEPLLVAERVQLWLDQGAVGPAEQLLAQHGASAGPTEGHVREALPLARARVLYQQGRYAEARALLDDTLRTAEAGGRQGRAIEALVLRALANDAEGGEREAHADLARALALAAAEGQVRSFLDGGARLVARLAESAKRRAQNDPLRAYAEQLLSAFSSELDGRSSSGLESTPVLRSALEGSNALTEPLTERELEVLRLMARGLTYQQIADSLIVSINTVRHHVKGIYGKLQVDTRTLALEQARELGLLS